MASPAAPTQDRKKRPWLLWSGVALSGALLAGGFWIFARSERISAREAWEGRLCAMADDRKLALETFIEERRGDAQVIAAYPTVRDLLAGGDGHGGDGDGDTHQTHLEAILASIVREYHYTAAFILDSQGAIRAQAGEAIPLDPASQVALDRFLTSGKPWEIGIHQGEGGRPHLTVRAAVVSGENPPPGRVPPGKPLGAILLVQDPGRWLYPRLRHEAVPTRTAESLLAHREGQEIVFLSPVRHRDLPPLTFRVPLENSHLAAAKAILGLEGFGEFVDYRGQPIFAATRRVRATDWGLVVKVDRSEALRETNQEVGLLVTAAVGLFLALWGTAFAVLRSRQVAHLREVAHIEKASRLQAEADAARIGQLNRLLTTLSDINQMVVRETEPGRLLREACRILVDKGSFRMAWVGLKEEGTGRVRPAAWAGHEEGFLSEIAPRYDDTPEGMGAIGRAIREGIPVVNHDLLQVPVALPWIEKALERGYRASAAFPLGAGGEVIGVLVVYASETEAFGEDEVGLLDELAGDLSYALQALETRKKKDEAEKALRQAESMMRMVMDHLPLGVAVNTVEQGVFFQYMNDNFIRFYRTTREALANPDSFWQTVYEEPGFREIIRKRVLDDCASGDPARLRWEDVPITRNGETFFVTAQNIPIPDQKMMISTVQDVTDRKRAEALLLTSEVRYRRLFEAARDGILILDAETGLVVDVNPFLIELLGFSHETFLGKTIWELGIFKDIVANQEHFVELQREEFIRYEDRPLETRDGRRIEVEFVSYLYRVQNRKVIQCNIRDITERKRIEEDLRRYRERLEDMVRARTAELDSANQELEAFTYSVSHDLKAPVRAMAGFSQILLEDLGAGLDEETRRLLGLIRDNSHRMGHLIEDLLQFSRVAKGEMVAGALDMNTLARSACEELRPSGAPSAEILWRGLPPAQGDTALLRQVWLNLFSNAFKFTRGRDAPRIEVGGWETGAECVYRVRDNGAGFDMRYADKLFGVFQRLHGQEEFPGTGVGLAIVQRIVQRHGGRVWAEGEVDKGATFYFSLPTLKGNAERGARNAEG